MSLDLLDDNLVAVPIERALPRTVSVAYKPSDAVKVGARLIARLNRRNRAALQAYGLPPEKRLTFVSEEQGDTRVTLHPQSSPTASKRYERNVKGGRQLPNPMIRKGKGIEPDTHTRDEYGTYHPATSHMSDAGHEIQSVGLGRIARRKRSQAVNWARKHKSTGTRENGGISYNVPTTFETVTKAHYHDAIPKPVAKTRRNAPVMTGYTVERALWVRLDIANRILARLCV